MTTPTFQRAHSQEQRAHRRATILDATTAMLAEMRVGQVTLTELSRRAGLAKSNVLRYFESREDVLLQVLDAAAREWLDALGEEFQRIRANTSVSARCDAVAEILTRTLSARTVFCDLIASQAAVLEHNVSTEVVAQFKRAAVANVAVLARLVGQVVPELSEPAAWQFAGTAVMMTGALWTHSRPSAAVEAAYQAHDDLAAMRLDFTSALRGTLTTLLAGLLARPPH
ncbi:MAG: TetR family transcriptional regulator [Actinobacteria bacterium 13_2_20CM_2_71_6]|nr:MAG: TetR family transcriptional regulator [Actinobacteria bacterium 13_2_20CM_2_71_6]